MAKKPSKKRAPERFMEPESDDHFAYIAGYTSGGAPYGITWEEQEEIEHRAAAKNSAIPPEQKETVSLNDVVQEMQIISDTMTVYFQRSTGKFITVTDEYIYAAESDAPLDDRPEWEQEIIRETAEFLAREDDGNNVPLPTRYDIHEYAIMEIFCSTVENRKIANDLFRSIAGKGAFRRFKDALHRHGIEKNWYAYKVEAYKEETPVISMDHIYSINNILIGAIIRTSIIPRRLQMQTAIKFSEDIVPLGDLKINPGRIVNQVDSTHRPVLLTSRGRGVAVIQSLKDYEANTEERAFMKAVLQGFADIDEGRTVSLADAKKRLGLV